MLKDMKRLIFLILILLLACSVIAQNPVCPIGTYIADPTARVWNDGRIYIYGSTDDGIGHWCSHKHDVLYSSDMKVWNIVSNVFSSKGENDSLPGEDPLLYAPDAMFRNGIYYLYFCTPSKTYSEGVATSDSPLGPFGNARKLNIGNYLQIDPTIFIDDDGQAYYYWGQMTLKGAKMKSNMVEIDESGIIDGLINANDHFFHEGAFVFKRNGIYYIVYAHHGRRDRRPTCLGYATSSSPLGPFKYGGVIIDNFGCDPESWNNHGSVAGFQGQWYVFYHRSSHGSQVMRRACAEPIAFNSDGSISEVEMTSQGAGKPLSAFSKIEAERACLLSGYCRIKLMPKEKDNEMISDIKSGDRAAYKYIDFGKGVKKFKVTATPYSGGTIVMRTGGPKGKVIGLLNIPMHKKVDQVYECNVSKTTGVKALWLEFRGQEEGTKLFNLDRFWFE